MKDKVKEVQAIHADMERQMSALRFRILCYRAISVLLVCWAVWFNSDGTGMSIFGHAWTALLAATVGWGFGWVYGFNELAERFKVMLLKIAAREAREGHTHEN